MRGFSAMEEVQQVSPPAAKPKLTKEERSKRMQDAATRRWAKARREKAKAERAKAASKSAKGPKKAPSPKEFSSALKTAEKRLAKAILERAEAAGKYAVLSAEIPSLQRLIVALRNPLGVMPEYAAPLPPTLEQIVGDQPLAYQNPPLPRAAPVQQVTVPTIPVPQPLHPANQASRGGGGAIGVELEEEEDENRFLKDSDAAGGQWH
jgi:hypothetical protein